MIRSDYVACFLQVAKSWGRVHQISGQSRACQEAASAPGSRLKGGCSQEWLPHHVDTHPGAALLGFAASLGAFARGRWPVVEMLVEMLVLVPQPFAASGGGLQVRGTEVRLSRALGMHRGSRDQLLQVPRLTGGTLRRWRRRKQQVLEPLLALVAQIFVNRHRIRAAYAAKPSAAVYIRRQPNDNTLCWRPLAAPSSG